MIEHLTVIPADSVIVVDGEALLFPFQAPANLHALQWHHEKGHIEYTDGQPNRELAKTDYMKEAAPFVTLWQAEKRRLEDERRRQEEEANKPPTLEEAKTDALRQIKEKRLAVEYAGPVVSIDGAPVRFPSEVKDETRLNSLAGLFQADPTAQIPDWKVADGVYVTMTAPLLQRVKAAGFAHIAATFSVERGKRDAVEALASAAAVIAWTAENIDTGWPA